MSDRGGGNGTGDLKRSPLRSEHIALGARFGSFGDAEAANDYGIPTDEPLPLDHPIVTDTSFMGLVRVAGQGAAFFLHTMLSVDVASLDYVGAGAHGLMLTAEGEVIDVVFVLRTGDSEYMLILDTPVVQEAVEWLDASSKVGDDSGRVFGEVEVADQTGSLASICMMGPRCSEVLDELAGTDPADSASFTGMLHSDGLVVSDALAGLPFMIAAEPDMEDAIWVWGGNSPIVVLWRALMGYEEIQAIGFEQLVLIRKAHGLWLPGVDEGAYKKPAEAGLEGLLRPGGGYVGAASLGC